MVSPQMSHALRQAGIIFLLGGLGAVTAEQTDILNNIGVDAIYAPIVVAVLAAMVRTVEGWRDRVRQEEGKVIQSDVAFDIAENLANPTVALLPTAVQTDAKTVYVDVLPPAGVVDVNDGIPHPLQVEDTDILVDQGTSSDASSPRVNELVIENPERPVNPGYTISDKFTE